MRKLKTPQKEILNESQLRDQFSTPNYATKLLLPFIPKDIKYIWECAAGDGKIADVLENNGYSVIKTDIRDCNGKNEIFNFLSINSKASLENTAIITNPPFSLKRRFFERCTQFNVPFALLLPFDISGFLISAFKEYNCQGIVPSRRINFIPPSGNGSGAQFHSFWLTRYFNLANQLNFADLSLDDIHNDI